MNEAFAGEHDYGTDDEECYDPETFPEFISGSGFGSMSWWERLVCEGGAQ
jgi:hypothetical protein